MSEKVVASLATLQPARRADADQVTWDEPEIEAICMNQEALQDVRAPAQMRATHAVRVVEMREGAFDSFAAPVHQASAAWFTNPATITLGRRRRRQATQRSALTQIRPRRGSCHRLRATKEPAS